MMYGADSLKLSGSAERRRSIGHIETRHEARQIFVWRRNVPADLHVSLAPFAGNDIEPRASLPVDNEQHLRR